MKKTRYEEPVCEIVRFNIEDVICTSPSNGDPGGTAPGFDWDNSWGTADNWED